MARILVVGLSALGESLVRALASRGVDVFGVDRERDRVDRLAQLSHVEVARLDGTQITALRQLLRKETIQTAVVAIGGNFLEAEQVAENLRELQSDERSAVGRILVVANRPHRRRILQTLGYDVVEPILRGADSLAVSLSMEELESFDQVGVDLEGEPFGVGEIRVPGVDGSIRVSDLEEVVAGVRLLGIRRIPRGSIGPAEAEVLPEWRVLLAGTPESLREAQRLLKVRSRSAAT